MAVDMFIKMDDFGGESKDKFHKGEIEVLSFSWGVTQSGSLSHGGGGGEGKASFQDLHFSSYLQKSSPRLFLACASGEHIKEATITVRKAGQNQDFYKMTLSEVLVSSFQQGASEGDHDDAPIEQVSLNFAKFHIEYRPQDEKGGLGQAIIADWDVVGNTQD